MCDSNEILTSQYERAVSLYQHEDKLNWQKVQHAVYLNGAFAAIVSVNIIQPIKWIVAALAAVFGLLFLIALENGRRFLQHRREAVQIVEKRIGDLGGIHPLIDSVQTPFWIPKTMTAMRVLLCLIIVAWSCLALYWYMNG